ncbi:MAG: hypothetical protein ACREBD_23960 [Blastocatellia bacterium]
MTTDTTPDTGARIRPLDWPETREVIGDRFDAGDSWVMILDAESSRFLIAVEEAHYTGEANDDLDVIVALSGQFFAVVAARKRRMNAKQLSRILRRFGIEKSKRELNERDLLVIVTPAQMLAARALVEKLLSHRDSLALAA